MPTELEEAVVDPDRGRRQLQHLGPNGDEPLFRDRARRYVRPAGRQRHVHPRQRAAVDFAIRLQRNRRQADERGRHHVVRQRLHQMRAQFLRGQLDEVVRGGVVGAIERDEVLLAGIPLRDDGAVVDLGVLLEPGFDLAHLDAEAADLDLRVDAAQILQRASVLPPRQVAGLIHAGAGRERVVDELLPRQVRTMQIATGESITREMQFTGHADRLWVVVSIENVDLRVRDRPANGLRPLFLP